MSLTFMPLGKTFLVAANATAPSGVQIVGASNDIKTNVLRLFNDDANQTVYAATDITAAGAKSNAVIPGASGNFSIPVAPRTEVVIRLAIATPQLFVSGITASATQANLMVTPGADLR